jgi:membrane protein DedA with SNARE-associated domain
MIPLLHALASLLLSLFHAHELATLSLALLFEEAGIPIPIPGDTLVTLAGIQTPHTIGNAIAVVSVSSIAVFLGSSVLFTVVRRGGRPLLSRYGKYVFLNKRHLSQMEQWFARRGRAAVILGRLVPGLRIPTTIMAGISGMAYSEFALTVAVAAVVWSAFYYGLGSVLGRTGPLIIALVADGLDAIPRWFFVLDLVILLISACLGAISWRIQQRHHTRQRRRRNPRRVRHVRSSKQESASQVRRLAGQNIAGDLRSTTN